MDARTRWVLKQKTWWASMLTLVGDELLRVPDFDFTHPSTNTLVRVGLKVVIAWSVTEGHRLNPPRTSLDDMSASEREDIFAKNPQVRARYYHERPWLVPPLDLDPVSLPPPLPPARPDK